MSNDGKSPGVVMISRSKECEPNWPSCARLAPPRRGIPALKFPAPTSKKHGPCAWAIVRIQVTRLLTRTRLRSNSRAARPHPRLKVNQAMALRRPRFRRANKGSKFALSQHPLQLPSPRGGTNRESPLRQDPGLGLPPTPLPKNPLPGSPPSSLRRRPVGFPATARFGSAAPASRRKYRSGFFSMPAAPPA